MNPGVGEEGVKVVGGIVDTFRQQPLSLALVIMNIALLVLFYIILTFMSKDRNKQLDLFYSDKKEISELLSRCIVPDKSDRRGELQDKNYKIQSDVSMPIPLPPLKPLPLEDEDDQKEGIK
jgi:hypothetical protein